MARPKGNRIAWWRHVALISTAFSPVVLFAADAGKGMLRRKRIAAEIKPNDPAFKAEQGNLADLWEQEAAQAEMDAERLLQFSFSMPTPAPTPPIPLVCLEGTTREDYIFNLVAAVTTPASLRDPTTPQGQAYNWMLNSDPLLAIDPCLHLTIEQRFGLATLYYATNGPQWTNSTGWLGGGSECTWYGVVCGETTPPPSGRALQGSPGRAYKLELAFNNLAGSLPNEMSTLYELENLNIFANSIVSSLPTGIGNMTKLVFLDAERNMLTGTLIPDTLVGLGNLQALRLSRNQFTGTIPTLIGQWTGLRQFWISNNFVVGSIPTEVGLLTDLQTVFLYQNKLIDAIPSEMGQLKQLSILRLDGNMLKSSIPEQFYDLTVLKSLRLDHNFLEGTISTAVGKLTGLEDLRLSMNTMLGGPIPSEMSLLTGLKNLIMFESSFSGVLPDIFGGYTQLEQLDLSMNRLTGTIPTSIFAQPNVKFVYLSNNTFFGPIPSNFQDPPQLRDLYLDGNQLTGEIPAVIPGRLTELNEILFNYNYLRGTMPQSFCDLRYDAKLDDLFANCGGPTPDVACDFPDCCNKCTMGIRQVRER